MGELERLVLALGQGEVDGLVQRRAVHGVVDVRRAGVGDEVGGAAVHRDVLDHVLDIAVHALDAERDVLRHFVLEAADRLTRVHRLYVGVDSAACAEQVRVVPRARVLGRGERTVLRVVEVMEVELFAAKGPGVDVEGDRLVELAEVGVQLRPAVAGDVQGEAQARRDHVAEPEIQLPVGGLYAAVAKRLGFVEANAEVQAQAIAHLDLVLNEQCGLVGRALRVLVVLGQRIAAIEERKR